MEAVAAAAAATSPVSASAAKEVEVEAEAEAATKELGGAAPITGRATNQARAPSSPTRANNARGMDWQTDKHVTYATRGKREISLAR